MNQPRKHFHLRYILEHVRITGNMPGGLNTLRWAWRNSCFKNVIQLSKCWEKPQEEGQVFRRLSASTSAASSHLLAEGRSHQIIRDFWGCEIPKWIRKLPRKHCQHTGWRQSMKFGSSTEDLLSSLLTTMQTSLSTSAWFTKDTKTSSLSVLCKEAASPHTTVLDKFWRQTTPKPGGGSIKMPGCDLTFSKFYWA